MRKACAPALQAMQLAYRAKSARTACAKISPCALLTVHFGRPDKAVCREVLGFEHKPTATTGSFESPMHLSERLLMNSESRGFMHSLYDIAMNLGCKLSVFESHRKVWVRKTS